VVTRRRAPLRRLRVAAKRLNKRSGPDDYFFSSAACAAASRATATRNGEQLT